MKRIYLFLLIAALAGSFVLLWKEHFFLPPFWEDIQKFKKMDQLKPPPEQAILFVGSSSIRMWKDLDDAFPEHTVINRGFGGSTLVDLHRYLDDIVLPYNPSQIVIYSGENDLASDGLDPQQVLQQFDSVFTGIRKQMPQVPITYISIKPSFKRADYMPAIEEANALIKNYLKNKPNTQFVDVYHPMLDSNGKPRRDIFIADSLHMNEKGYQIWAEVIRPYLRK